MSRWRRARLPVLLAVLLLALPTLGVVLAGQRPSRGLDPDSAAPGGARAVAEVLREQGVPVQRVERVATAAQALSAADDEGGAGGGAEGGATLVVSGVDVLSAERWEELAALGEDTGADLVLLAPGEPALEVLAPDLVLAGADDDPPAEPLAEEVVAAGCSDPDAAAAGEALAGGLPLRAAVAGDPAVTTCFGGSYAVVDEGGRAVRVLGQPAVVTNEHLDEAGHAALALRALGSSARVVWLVANPLDTRPGDPAAGPLALLPPWVDAVAVQLLLAAVVAVLWRARRLGRLVAEPLPVVVRSVEAVEGRAALYRAARDRAAASTALRAAAAARLGARLGLPAGTPADRVAHAAAAACGRDPRAVAALLAGPPPREDRALVALAGDLDDLENDVRSAGRLLR
ncbi:DUF4350 domain-containing protein [Quadrisphaera sp. DSM 44207]|uniref:DUF4350 domain-containing protein n=1 Tax=Quadrisphaera sp. DSM 44207 TaxID=1881057 RepID=UPI00088EE60B|nr:DUF4350 domain-containing protein [Quadrisphaera sp. DSM 44207]SDQ09096.1 protein of unknown function [Quadrisphaera sp. DSM 44207]